MSVEIAAEATTTIFTFFQAERVARRTKTRKLKEEKITLKNGQDL